MDQNQLERLVEIGPALAGGLDLETVLRRIVDAAREVTGARYAALGVLDSEGAGLERFITAGLTDEETARIGDLPRGRGVLGELITHPEPLRLKNVGDHPRSYGFPVGHPPMQNFLGVPIRVRSEVYGNLYLTEKAEGDFDDADEETVLHLADWAGIAIDNARLYGSARERQYELERTVEVLETNVEIARAIGAATELEPVLDLVVKRGRALVEARGVALALVRGDELVVTHTAGPLSANLVGYRLPWEKQSAGFRDRGAWDRVPPQLDEALKGAAEAKTCLAVPLVFRNWLLGVVAAFDRTTDEPEFTPDDRRLLRAFAASASIAVASAQRATQRALHQSIEASERERARWARELHDETLQDIGALRVLLTTARNSNDPAAVAAAVEDAVGRLGEMGGALRGLISDLRPALLDQLGLTPALGALIDRLRDDTDIEVRLHADTAYASGRRPDRLAPEVELAVYRVVQEALNNVVKHSGANRAEVTVSDDDAAVRISVRDDGNGFDPSATYAGFGLTGIRERVAQHGGNLEIASGPGRGTDLRIVIPARHASEPATAPPMSIGPIS
jgi:signal transduction histidine kinase